MALHLFFADWSSAQTILASTCLGNDFEPRVTDDVPVLLDERLYPAQPWCRFLRQYSLTVSVTSMRAYAYDLARFASFLESRGVRVEDAVQDDLVAYRRGRQSAGISDPTWRRELVVIRALFEYLVRVGVRSQTPWIEVAGHSVVRPRTTTSDMQVRALTRGQWEAFRDVGMGGRLPGGGFDASFRGRFPTRDMMVADLAVTTGMRIQEWRSVLEPEFQPVAGRGATLVLHAAAKNGRRRTVYVPGSTMASIEMYRRTERRRAVMHAQEGLRRRWPGLAQVSDIDPARGRITYVLEGTRYRCGLAEVPLAHRGLLVREEDGVIEPLSLLVGPGGLAPSQRAWHETFARANRRLHAMGEGIPMMPPAVTPHDLRHTFAVVVLRSLQLRAAGLEAGRSGAGEGTLSEHVVFNPLLTLQRLMGHASPSTTMVYLRYIDDSAELVQRAFESWSDQNRDFASFVLEQMPGPEAGGRRW